MSDHTARHTLPLTVRANFAWNFAGKMAFAASRGLILIIIAKLGTALMVGQYALAFAVTGPVFMLADLDLRSVLATDSRERMSFGHYMGLRMMTTLLAMAAVLVLSLLQGERQTGLIILLVGVSKGVDSLSDILFGLMQKNERLNRLGISFMIKSTLSLLAVCLSLLLGYGILWGVGGMALVGLGMLLFYDIPAARHFASLRPHFSMQKLWELAKLSLPLGGVLLFVSLNKNMPSYFIEAFHGSETLGYFSAMVYIITTGSLVVTALGQSTNARLARLLGSGNVREFLRVFRRNILLTAGLAVCMLLVAAGLGGQILTLLYTPEYAVWKNVFIIIMGAGGILYTAEITASALTAAQQFKIQPIISGGVLLAGLVLNFLLVPRWGLPGAALCVLTTSALYLAGNLIVLYSITGRPRGQTRIPGGDQTGGPGLSVERISFPDSRIIPQWKRILGDSHADMAFSDPQWLMMWWRCFGDGHEPLVLAVRDGDEIVAVFPLMISAGRRLKRITWMGHPQATHMDIACSREYLDRAAETLYGYLESMDGSFIVSLTGLRDRDGLFAALMKELQAHRQPMAASSAPSFVMETGTVSYDAFMRRFSSGMRKKFRKQESRLAAMGTVSVREIKGPDMDPVFALHHQRWRKKLDTSGFTDDQSRVFFSDLLSVSDDRWRAMALGVYVNDRLAAFLYGFVCGGRALLYRSGYDDFFSMCAMGMMVKREYVRRCLDKGMTAIDLGAGYEDYKTLWTDEREMIRSLVFPAGGMGARVAFLFRYARETLRGAMKKSRRIVLFKRNTLGRWKYNLSPGRLIRSCRLGMAQISRRGWRVCLPDRIFGRGLAVLTPAEGFNTGQGNAVEGALPCDAGELAVMMNCTREELGKRFYHRNRCMMIRREGAIACAAWVTEGQDGLVISDCRADWRSCRQEDILKLLQGTMASLIREGWQQAVELRIDRRETRIIRAACQAGFAFAATPKTPGQKGEN